MSGIPAGAGSLLGKRLGKYEIVALLALGGTAEIYLARIAGAAGFEKYVVVKCLHDHLADDIQFVKMFLDEARLAAHLDHSNVVQTMELGEHESRYYMVMEFLAGLSLAMIVRRAGERLPSGRIPIPLVLNMVAQACAGLHYAHERMANGKPLNIVHRDISPQNLVVGFEGVVKVVDFGIAKAELRETQTQSGTIKGKFAYMSPEQCVANNVDRRTDVFALGVITHELLTGRRLFKKASPYETYQAVLECAVPPPSRLNAEVDHELDPIVMRALTKDRVQRYQTAEAYGDALLGYLHHRGKGSGPGDVARFFDGYFTQEIEEHGARMRELISGREVVSGEGTAMWSADDEGRRREPSLEGVPTNSEGERALSPVDPAELVPTDGRGAGALPSVLDDIDDRRPDDDDLPAERTRIEANPLERVNELEAIARGQAAGAQRPPGAPAPPPPLLPTLISSPGTPPQQQPPPHSPASGMATQIQMPPSGPLPLPAAPTGPVPSSNRFLANLPTVISEEDPAAGFAEDLAQTQIGDAHGHVDPMGPTRMDMAPPNLSSGARGSGPTLPQPQPPGSPGPHGSMPGPGPGPHGSMPGPGPHGPMPGPHAQGPHMPGSHGPGPHGPGPGPIAPHDATVLHGPPGQPPMGQRPPTPPNLVALPMSYPVVNKEMGRQMLLGATVYPSDFGAPQQGRPHDGNPYDPQRAADIASPVGRRFPGDIDWEAAAAKPARYYPPWMLAAMFVGALTAALLVTILIAKLAG